MKEMSRLKSGAVPKQIFNGSEKADYKELSVQSYQSCR